MKLQIVEYRAPNMLEGNIHYRYMLELDKRVVLCTPPSPMKKELKNVYNILMSKLLDENIDYNMEHYVKFNKLPGIEIEVIFETIYEYVNGFDMTPNGIIRTLDLKNTNYVKTASGGHFGRNEFTWEKVKV